MWYDLQSDAFLARYFAVFFHCFDVLHSVPCAFLLQMYM